MIKVNWPPGQEFTVALSVRQIATALCVHHRTVRRWIHAGHLHAAQIATPKGRIRVSRSELERFMRDGSAWLKKGGR